MRYTKRRRLQEKLNEKMLFNTIEDSSSSGTDSTTLLSETLPKNTMGTHGCIRIIAWGTMTGTGGSKQVALYFGSAYFGLAASGAYDWWLELIVRNCGETNSQFLLGKSLAASPDGVIGGFVDYSAEDTTVDVIIKVIGTCADGGDVITQKGMTIEYMD